MKRISDSISLLPDGHPKSASAVLAMKGEGLREKERQTDRQTQRQTDRHTERQTETETQRDRCNIKDRTSMTKGYWRGNVVVAFLINSDPSS